MTFDKKMNRRQLLKTSAVIGAAGMVNLSAPAILRAQEPEKPEELIVRAWGGPWVEALKNGVSDPFTEATGIRIKHDLTDAIEVQPKVWAAVQQGRTPPMHVYWDLTTNATKSALRGVCEDLSGLSNFENTTDLAKPVGLDGYGLPMINTYGYVYLMIYRPEAFPDGPPKSYKDLLDPKFKGRIAFYDNGSGLHFPAQVAGGGSLDDIPANMDAAWDFITELKGQDPLLGTDPDFVTWLQNGEIDAGCTISTNALGARKNGIDVAWTVPEEGAKFDTDCLWVPKGHSESEVYWAKQYINQALSKESQQVWLDGLGLPGVVPGLTPPPGIEIGDPSYPTTEAEYEKLIRISGQIQIENQSEWFATFKSIMQA